MFTSKFVPSASFNNLVASIKNTRLSQRQYVMANVTSKVSLDCMKVDEEPTPVKGKCRFTCTVWTCMKLHEVNILLLLKDEI